MFLTTNDDHDDNDDNDDDNDDDDDHDDQVVLLRVSPAFVQSILASVEKWCGGCIPPRQHDFGDACWDDWAGQQPIPALAAAICGGWCWQLGVPQAYQALVRRACGPDAEAIWRELRLAAPASVDWVTPEERRELDALAQWVGPEC